jgi:hypothetical protein
MGPTVYNALHTWVAWAGVFVVRSLLAGSIEWPLLGRAAHIAMDRASEFSLRAPVRTHP